MRSERADGSQLQSQPQQQQHKQLHLRRKLPQTPDIMRLVNDAVRAELELSPPASSGRCRYRGCCSSSCSRVFEGELFSLQHPSARFIASAAASPTRPSLCS